MNDIINRIKKKIEGQSKKKMIENTVIVIIIGIIIIIAGGTMFGNDKLDISQKENKKTVEIDDDSKASSYIGDETEKKLKLILSQVQGVGKIDVMITYATSRENIPAYDLRKSRSNTSEEDSEGGTRNIEQEEYDSTIVYEDSIDGGKEPVILKELQPEIKGVLVVAEGAERVEVRERLHNAVMVVLDIPAHRVQVVQRKK